MHHSPNEVFEMMCENLRDYWMDFLRDFPKRIVLVPRAEEGVKWFEFWQGRGSKLRGIVIQKDCQCPDYYLLFIKGGEVRTFSEQTWSRGVHPVTTFKSVHEAVETLRDLGFEVILRE